MNVYDIILFQHRVPLIVLQPLGFIIFLTASIAEVERPPFDIPTGESEVAGGVFIEYSGIRWSMFQLTSYVNMYVFSAARRVRLPRRLGVAVRPRRRLGLPAAADGR